MIFEVNLILMGQVSANSKDEAEKIINQYLDLIGDVPSGTFHYPNVDIKFIREIEDE